MEISFATPPIVLIANIVITYSDIWEVTILMQIKIRVTSLFVKCVISSNHASILHYDCNKLVNLPGGPSVQDIDFCIVHSDAFS